MVVGSIIFFLCRKDLWIFWLCICKFLTLWSEGVYYMPPNFNQDLHQEILRFSLPREQFPKLLSLILKGIFSNIPVWIHNCTYTTACPSKIQNMCSIECMKRLSPVIILPFFRLSLEFIFLFFSEFTFNFETGFESEHKKAARKFIQLYRQYHFQTLFVTSII